MRGPKRWHSSNLRTLTFFDYLFFLLGFDAEAQSTAEIASWSGSTRLTTDTSKSAPISGSCFSSVCFFACLSRAASLGRINSGRKSGWRKTSTSTATHKSYQSTGNDYYFLSHAVGLSNEYANTDKEKLLKKESQREAS